MGKTIKRETKVSGFTPTNVDEDQGLVDHIVTVFGIVDEGNDVCHPGAFAKTITERAGRIRVLDMHNQGSIFSAIGVPKRLWEVGRAGLPQKLQAEWPEATGALMATTQFLMDTPEGKGAFARIKAGAINEFSYTYDCLDSEYGKAKNHEGKVVTVRNLRAVRLWEMGPVIWGMNQATGVIDAKKLGGSEGKPYIKVKEGDEWVVYKEDADKKPVGDPLGKHPTEEAADAQLAALYASMKDEGKAAEALEDATAGVSAAFNAQFTDGSAETYSMPTTPWVLKTYDTYIIAEYEGKVYKVNYRGADGQYDFDTRDTWVEVEQAWQPVSTGAPEPEVTAADSHDDPNVPKSNEKAGRVLAARNVARITGAVQALAEALSEVGVIIKVEAQAAAEAPADNADEPKAGKAAGPNPQGSPTTADEARLRLIEVGVAELDLL